MSETAHPRIADYLARLPRERGTPSALARATGVSRTTSGRWLRGEVSPEPARWAAIERFFGWPDGLLAQVAGYVVPPQEVLRQAVPATIAQLEAAVQRIDELEGRIADLEGALARENPVRQE